VPIAKATIRTIVRMEVREEKGGGGGWGVGGGVTKRRVYEKNLLGT
jgi:hypothetical protein